MHTVPYTAIVNATRELCMRAASKLPDDVACALRKALDGESSPAGREIIRQCIDNAALAAAASDPICQDTGIAIYFVELGSNVLVDGGTLADALSEGTRLGYRDGYLRKSMVADPLFDRTNTGDNTPVEAHIEMVAGDALRIVLLPKGGGAENMSRLAMLKPSDGAAGVADFVADAVAQGGGRPCPPLIVGVGIGGAADTAMYLAKRALLRPVGAPNPDARYARLEADILAKINASGVGPQGLGGSVTALAVHIEERPCHLASLPVAVNVNCHAARRAEIIL